MNAEGAHADRPQDAAVSASGEPGSEPATCTSLIPLSPPGAAPVAPCRPLAAFVAQMIATRRHVAQTRARRRAKPAHAVKVYAATRHVTERGPAPVTIRRA